MQVTCPNCRARYAVDPLAIGPSGRTVQCARCSERWFQLVKSEPAPEPAPVAAAPVAKPTTAPKRLMPWFLSKPAAAKAESAKADRRDDDDRDEDRDDGPDNGPENGPDDGPDDRDRDRDPGPPPAMAAKSRLSRPGLLKWLPFAGGPKKLRPERKPNRKPRREPDVEASPDRDKDRTGQERPAAAQRIDTQPVPDVVIRPPTRGASLPALIEPKVERGLSLALVGTLVVLLLLAAGILAFHNVIADQLPVEWRSILRFDA